MSLNLKNNPYNAIVSEVKQDVRQGDFPLSGWRVSLKDNVNMKGTLTTASSMILSNYKSIYNATIVDKLIDSGAHIVAKTAMDELNMGGTNRNAISGPVTNPYDETRISGGSSGGSAALSGAGLVRLALGSDTGDSVRKPASYCGSVGVKPSYGRISRYGIVAYSSSLDHVGYFTQNVKDAAKALEFLAGYDVKDMTSSQKPVPAYSALLDIDLQGKRIGIFKNVVDVIENEVIKESFTALCQDLQDKGAILVEKEMDPQLARAMLGTYLVIANGEAVTHHASLDGVRFGKQEEGASLEEIMINTRTKGFSPFVKERLIYGQYAIEHENMQDIFLKAKKVRRLLVESYQAMMADVDIMLAPATPDVAPKIEDINTDYQSDRTLIGENHMVINNFTGYPSMTIPLGKADHLPFGLNISAKAFEEETMFQYANELEQLIQWKGDF